MNSTCKPAVHFQMHDSCYDEQLSIKAKSTQHPNDSPHINTMRPHPAYAPSADKLFRIPDQYFIQIPAALRLEREPTCIYLSARSCTISGSGADLLQSCFSAVSPLGTPTRTQFPSMRCATFWGPAFQNTTPPSIRHGAGHLTAFNWWRAVW